MEARAKPTSQQSGVDIIAQVCIGTAEIRQQAWNYALQTSKEMLETQVKSQQELAKLNHEGVRAIDAIRAEKAVNLAQISASTENLVDDLRAEAEWIRQESIRTQSNLQSYSSQKQRECDEDLESYLQGHRSRLADMQIKSVAESQRLAADFQTQKEKSEGEFQRDFTELREGAQSELAGMEDELSRFLREEDEKQNKIIEEARKEGEKVAWAGRLGIKEIKLPKPNSQSIANMFAWCRGNKEASEIPIGHEAKESDDIYIYLPPRSARRPRGHYRISEEQHSDYNDFVV